MQFTTIEVELEADGEHRIESIVPRFGNNDERTVLVLVEQLDAEFSDFEAWIEEGVEPLPSLYNRIRTFGGRLTDKATSITLWLRTGIRARFRVFIGWVSRKMRELIDRLPCKGCKAVVRAALKAGLAAIGVPAPDGAEAKFLATELTRLLDWDFCGRIADFVDAALGEGSWKWLWTEAAKMADPINRAYKLVDGAFEYTCRAMRLCP